MPTGMLVADADRVSRRSAKSASSRRFAGLLDSPERMRLRTEVVLLRHATGRPTQVTPANSEEGRARAESIRSLLAHAEDSALAGNIDEGWKHFHQARRLHIADFTPAELDALRATLADESREKLTNWRGVAVQNLLALNTLEGLLKAQCCVDEHADNAYFRNRLLRRQMSIISCVLVVALIALIGQLLSMEAVPLENGVALTPTAIGLAMTLGAIAACLSALIGFSSVSTDQRIPERSANVLITLTRPLIGAASGLAGLLAVHSKLVNLPISGVGWIVPFVFGFSERVVLGVVEPSRSKAKS
jgi:hypothetical protein